MSHSQMIRSMVQAQDEPVRSAPKGSRNISQTSSKRSRKSSSSTVTADEALRYHVKSILARDRVLSRTNNNELSLSIQSKKPQRLPIRDAARLPEPTFNKVKHERVKKEVALRKITKKLQQRAKEEKKQLKKSVKKQSQTRL